VFASELRKECVERASVRSAFMFLWKSALVAPLRGALALLSSSSGGGTSGIDGEEMEEEEEEDMLLAPPMPLEPSFWVPSPPSFT